jgi:formamidopyrimidine-DNA glycosylase
MPELPEVEIFRRFLERYALKQTICAVSVLHPKGVRSIAPEILVRLTEGSAFLETQRRGKILLARLGKTGHDLQPSHHSWVLFHFGMTAYFSYTPPDSPTINAYGDRVSQKSHIRVSFRLADGGLLNFHDQRLFGYVSLIDNPEAYFQSKKLGPDALAVDRPMFIQQLNKRKGAIKPVLMDQAVIAGLGNVYADELLFQANLHPEHAVADLNTAQLEQLHALMQEILKQVIDLKVDREKLPADYLWHQRNPKGLCPRDHSPFLIKTIGGRTTYFCAKCQH